MKNKSHNLLLSRTFQYLGIILIMGMIGGGYWYWKNAQAGVKLQSGGQEAALSNGLVGYWSFDGNDISGTTAYDRSGQGNNGTLTNGPTKTIGKAGQALSFDGTTQRVSVGTGSGLSSVQYTVSAWVNVNSSIPVPAGQTARVVTRRDPTVASWYNANYIFQINGNSTSPAGTISLIHVRTNHSTVDSVNGVTDLRGAGWKHVVGLYDGSYVRVYVNGVLEKSVAAGNPETTGPQTLDIAWDQRDLGNYFPGKVDEVRVYNRALSQSEVTALYDMGTADKIDSADAQIDPLEKGMIGYWKLDDGSGTSATDSSGNGNTGTLTNGPTWTTGQIGGALSLSGSSQYVNLGSTSAALQLQEQTVSAWVYVTASHSEDPIVTREYVSTDGWEWTLLNLKPSFAYYDGGIRGWFTSTGSIPTSQWTLVTGVWRKSAGKVDFYINGALDSTVTTTTGTIVNASSRIAKIGGRNVNGNTFTGSIDEVRVYNRALSADEVAKLYRTTAPDNPDQGLVGYWPFDGKDISGTTAYDRSGKGNNGTLTNGPTKTIGKVGQGMAFDGSNDYVDVPYTGIDFERTDPHSFSVWVKRTSVNDFQSIFARYNSGSYRGEFFALSRTASWLANANSAQFYFQGGAGSVLSVSTPTDSVLPGDWYHIVATYDGSSSASGVKMYLNGANQTLTVHDNSLATTTKQNLNWQIGNDQSGDPYQGTLDEVRVYNRVLSQSEVTALYDMGAADKVNSVDAQIDPLEKGMIGYWKLDDGSGTSATDSSGNGNTGTLTNGPTWTTGQIGGALSFDGSNDYVDLGQILNYMPQMTISYWLNLDNLPSSSFYPVSKSSGQGAWRTTVSSSGIVTFVVGTTNNSWYSSGTAATSSVAISSGSWNLVTATYDGMYVRIFINGVQAGVGSQAISGDIRAVSPPNTYIAHQDYGQYTKGIVDEVRAYNRALSADEVAKLYRTTAPDNPDTGLVGYWSFDGRDISGTTIYDRSRIGGNGTLTNSPSRVIGKVRQGLSFNGTNQSASLGSFTASDYTVSAWVKYRGTSYGSSYAVFGWDNYPTTPRAGLVVKPYSSGAYQMETYANGTGTTVTNILATVADWNFLTVVRSGTTVQAYVNGSASGTPVTVGSGSYVFSNGRFGSHYYSGSNQEFGNVVGDEVRIYNRALSQSEITALYSAGR